MLDSIYKKLDLGRESVIEWQREMTARPAIGPENQGTGEAEKAKYLLSALEELSFQEITEYNADDPRVPCRYRPNISAKIPGKSDQTLWLIAHMDVVPPGEKKLWNSDPYELKLEGDLVFGRGVEDNQQGIVSAMLAAKALMDAKVNPELSLGLLLVSDEETGMSKGLPHVLKTAPELISKDDLILVPDIGNAKGTMVQVAEKGCLWLKIEVLGQQCHASTPDKGINSLLIAAECILSLERLYKIFHKKNNIFTPPWSTFVPTKKDANVENINTIPGKDVFYVDCRILSEYNLDEVVDECRKITEEIAKKSNSSIKLEVVNRMVSTYETPADSPLVQKLLSALKELRDVEGKISGSGGQTVCSILRNMGFPAVAWSTLTPNAHSPNEHSSISNTIADAKIIARILFPES